MSSPERQSLIATAVTDAVDGFCAVRKPRSPDRVARPPAAADKQTLSPGTATEAGEVS